uniref:Uncharacterized protein n=1 Tax=Cannabis sativa TaxID=3483 RepID=A0A803P4I2_CANSA
MEDSLYAPFPVEPTTPYGPSQLVDSFPARASSFCILDKVHSLLSSTSSAACSLRKVLSSLLSSVRKVGTCISIGITASIPYTSENEVSPVLVRGVVRLAHNTLGKIPELVADELGTIIRHDLLRGPTISIPYFMNGHGLWTVVRSIRGLGWMRHVSGIFRISVSDSLNLLRTSGNSTPTIVLSGRSLVPRNGFRILLPGPLLRPTFLPALLCILSTTCGRIFYIAGFGV